jgi:MFS family permease
MKSLLLYSAGVSTSARAVIASVRPLFLGLGVLMLGTGLLGTVVGIRAQLEQFPTAVAGVVMSCFYLGFLIGCWIAPRMVQRKGHVKMYVVFATLGAVAAVAYPLVTNPLAWSIIRVVTGATMAGLYVVCESWLAGIGNPKTRGRLLAVYLLVVNESSMSRGIAGGHGGWPRCQGAVGLMDTTGVSHDVGCRAGF